MASLTTINGVLLAIYLIFPTMADDYCAEMCDSVSHSIRDDFRFRPGYGLNTHLDLLNSQPLCPTSTTLLEAWRSVRYAAYHLQVLLLQERVEPTDDDYCEEARHRLAIFHHMAEDLTKSISLCSYYVNQFKLQALITPDKPRDTSRIPYQRRLEMGDWLVNTMATGTAMEIDIAAKLRIPTYRGDPPAMAVGELFHPVSPAHQPDSAEPAPAAHPTAAPLLAVAPAAAIVEEDNVTVDPLVLPRKGKGAKRALFSPAPVLRRKPRN